MTARCRFYSHLLTAAARNWGRRGGGFSLSHCFGQGFRSWPRGTVTETRSKRGGVGGCVGCAHGGSRQPRRRSNRSILLVSPNGSKNSSGGVGGNATPGTATARN